MLNNCSENPCSSPLKEIILLTFLCLFPSPNIFSQNNEPRFEHITIEDGLPENSITAILQDHLGYMWFGTQDGLARYDGYKFINYKTEIGNPRSISDNWISTIYEDHLNNLWIGTQPLINQFDDNDTSGGLNLFVRKTESFTQFKNNKNDSNTINSNYVTSIREDDLGNLWVGTNAGLNLLDRNKKTFQRVKFLDKSLTEETYDFISTLNSQRIESITKVGNNIDARKKIIIKEKTIVMAVILGEEAADFGWVENSQGTKVIEYEEVNNFYAGGRSDNRITIIIDTLELGSYILRYKSDASHSYNNWRNNSIKPFYPEWWGIQVFSMNDSTLKAFLNIKISEQFETKVVVHGIIQDKVSKKIFIATNWGLFAFYPPNNDRANSNIVIKISDKLKVGLGFLTNIFQSRNGIIWLGASVNGLFSYNPTSGEVKPHKNPNTISQSISSFSNIITEDSKGNLWYGNPTDGLIKFDPVRNKFDSYKYDEKDKNSLNGNTVWSVYEDKSGVLWIGTRLWGLDKWDKKKWKFNSLKYNPFDRSILSGFGVLGIWEDWKERLWILTNNGIDIYDNSNEMFSKKYFNKLLTDTFDHNYITSLIEDTDKDIYWIGTAQKGLLRYNSKTNSIKQYDYNFNDEFTLSAIGILDLSLGNKDDIWIGGIDGLYNLDKKSNKIIKLKLDPNDTLSLNDNIVLSLFKDSRNDIWIGSNSGGLFKYEKELNSIIPHPVFLNQKKNGNIQDIFEDKLGNLWVGTFENGFYNYDRDQKKLKETYTQKEGLSSNLVQSILSDDNGNLWIGTQNGLSFFNIISKKIRKYFIEDGLCSNYFVEGKLKSKKGILYFGTDAGLIYFHPDSILIDSIPPQVVIQDISLFNRPDEKLEYEGFISEIKEITLPYNQNDLHFEYVGLHYGEPLRNQYKYILEGFDKEWIDAGNLRTATYTNLDPGEYIFKVIASNRDGVWNETGASLKVIINPPLWATTWAYILYLILFGSILYYTWKMQLKRVKVKHDFEMSKFEAQKLHEVDEIKSRFFANISHEFRTPLTLILGPAEKIINSESPNPTKEANIIKTNAHRLLELVNQLLDLSKIDAGKLQLKAIKSNIVSFTKNLALSFESLAEAKDINLRITSDKEYIELYFDKDKMTKIIGNLLSNSFKFTQEGGEINIGIKEPINNKIEIKISDTGIGIPANELPKLFDRFYQIDSSHTKEYEGTGIGLALVKELVELHQGFISVKSTGDNKDKSGKSRTEFTIQFPIGRNHLKDQDIIDEKNILQETDTLLTYEGASNQKDAAMSDSSSIKIKSDNLITESKPIILIVEDNYDMRQFIRESLIKNYLIEEAGNGEQGFRIAEKIIPDLIITDLMMPKMDGSELTKRLKSDERTSHIPVIVLTAKSGKEDLLEGLETGADEYITKPFNTKELKIRIANLLNLRKHIQEKVSKGDFKGIQSDKKLKLIDQKFLDKVNIVIDNHLSKEEFSIEELSVEIGMSRTQLHRKLKALTGKSASQYLRTLRLNKAKQMIQNGEGNISEIAYLVGFSSPAYFSRCFKEEFGYPPREN